MALSLRTRLTLWYSALLLLALGLFTATVLWVHWTLLLRQADESLEALGLAAANVVAAELDEHLTMADAAREMEAVVPRGDYMVTVFDAGGTPVHSEMPPFPFDRAALSAGDDAPRTVRGPGGRAWRT